MSTIVSSFRRGAWEAHVIRTNHITGPRLRVRLDHPNGYNTDWPVKYENGTIGYDHYKAPRDAQRAARAAFNALEGCDDCKR